MTPVAMMIRRFRHVVALIGAEHAFDAADHATDRGANDRADRTGDAIAFIEPMRGAAGDTLRVRGQRHGERRDKRARNQQVLFHKIRFFRFA
jgi:hypothetical protein